MLASKSLDDIGCDGCKYQGDHTYNFFSFIRKLQQGAKFAHLPRGGDRFDLTQKKVLQYANT